jgi:uncharacterized integral membrane protein (TIGR00697 family)
MKAIELKTDILLGFFVVSLVLANTLGTKITSLLGVRVSVGIFFIPILFLVTDIIAEVHGKKKATEFVLISIAILVFTLVMMYFAIKLPANATWGGQEHFAFVFGSGLRMTIASVIAFVISQFHDVWSFHFWKQKTHGKWLWLRNNLSTAVSQLIDTIIFMFIAFYALTPKFTVPFIISLIIPYWLFKIGFALIDTPFCYLGVKWLRKE